MSEPVPVTKEALDRVDTRLSERIRELDNRISDNKASIIELKTLCNTLVKLPDTMSSLEKSLIRIDHNMETMATRMDSMAKSIRDREMAIEELREENKKQNIHIDEVDNKSKVDWANFLTGNFWNLLFKAVVGIAAIMVAYKTFTGT